MKRLILFLLLSPLYLIAQGQTTPPPPSPPPRHNNQVLLVRSNQISLKILDQKKDLSRMEMYHFYADYLATNNIYPNEDAIDLIDAYNKKVTYWDIESDSKLFKPLLLNADSNFNKPKIMLLHTVSIELFKDRLKMTSDIFRKKQQMVNELADSSVPVNFKNKLLAFTNVVLPRINTNASRIPLLQLDFFLNSMADINRFMNQFADRTSNAIPIEVISELMNDFFEYNVQPAVKPMKRNPPSNSYQKTDNIFRTASFTQEMNHPLVPTERDNLPNADVYVYTRDSLGQWEQKPKPNAFNVYYGANGLKYSLTPGCDTLSFFRYHPLVPASTLPIVLAKGNYCFVLQDIVTNKLHLRTGINLRDNTLIDENKLIKLCFNVEK